MRELDLGSITAYGDAKKAGFTGSYDDFCNILARLNAGSGVQSYVQLANKPKINGVELVGNLTSEDLGIRTRGSRVEVLTGSTELFGETVTISDGYETMTANFDDAGKCVFESVLMGGTMIVSCTHDGKTSRSYVQCPYFANYKTTLTYSDSTVYSFIIDHGGDGVDDSAMVSYADGAQGMEAGSADLLLNDPFYSLKPCILVDGVVQAYLDPNDFTKTIDGQDVDTSNINISSLPSWYGNTADHVFNQYIEVPCMGLRSEWLDDNRLYLSIAVGSNVGGFDYSAFEYGGEICDKIYLGRKAYVSGEEGAVYAQRVETGTPFSTVDSRENYGMMGYAQFELFQYLLMLYYKKIRITREESNIFGFVDLIPNGSGSNGVTYPTKCVIDNAYLRTCENITMVSKGDADYGRGITGYMKKPYGIVGKTFLCETNGANASTFYGTPYAYARCSKRTLSGDYAVGYYQPIQTIFGVTFHPRSEKGTTVNGQTGILGHRSYMRSMYMHKIGT